MVRRTRLVGSQATLFLGTHLHTRQPAPTPRLRCHRVIGSSSGIADQPNANSSQIDKSYADHIYIMVKVPMPAITTLIPRSHSPARARRPCGAPRCLARWRPIHNNTRAGYGGAAKAAERAPTTCGGSLSANSSRITTKKTGEPQSEIIESANPMTATGLR